MRATISATANDFWSAYLDEDTTRRLYTEGLHFDGVEIRAENQHASERRTRELHYAPRLNMPAPIKGALGARLRIVERGTFVPAEDPGGVGGPFRFSQAP